MSEKSDELIAELVSACIAFGREKEPDWQTRIETAQRELRDYIAELEAERDDWRKSYLNLWRHINNLPQPPEVQE